MNRETREELVLAATRWCNNMLVEVISNHNNSLSREALQQLRNAVSALAAADRAIRFPKLQELSDEAQEQGRYEETFNPLRNNSRD